MINSKPRRMVPRSFFWNRTRNKIARLIELAIKRGTEEMLDQDRTALIRDPQWLLIQQLIVDRCGRPPRAEYEEITLDELFKCIDQNRLDLWQPISDVYHEWAIGCGVTLPMVTASEGESNLSPLQPAANAEPSPEVAETSMPPSATGNAPHKSNAAPAIQSGAASVETTAARNQRWYERHKEIHVADPHLSHDAIFDQISKEDFERPDHSGTVKKAVNKIRSARNETGFRRARRR
jgi:hypothetical protein